MRKVLFIIIVLFCLVLAGASCGSEKTESVKHRVSNTSYDEYDCEDFGTWKQAQGVFESAGGVENDVYGLDRDKDGIACEALR